jgi:hypothetical protein
VSRLYEFTVTLDETDPSVWRSFLLSADATFADLHRAIQDAAGWQNYHLYEFSTLDGTGLAGLPDDEMADWAGPIPDAALTHLDAYFDEHEACRYLYDFGDHWQHTVRRTGTVDTDEHVFRRLLDGARAFPPEDCGGIPGYEQCAAVARGQRPEQLWHDPDHLRVWMGDWHPDRFDRDRLAAAFTLTEPPPGPASPFEPLGFPRLAAGRPAATVDTPRDDLVEAARTNAVLARLAAFTAWAGSGHKLTATGNLTRADGRELIDVLDTDDPFDEQIGERVFKTKSSTELREVDFTFRLARKAGFVKVRNKAVSATKRGARLGGDPLADWLDAFDGLVRLGVLTNHYAHATWIDPYWKELVDEQVPGLFAQLIAIDALLIVHVHARLWALIEASFILDDLDEAQRGRHRDHLDGDVRWLCAVFADLGALRVEGVETVTNEWGHERPRGGYVSLTPLGVVAARQFVDGA